MESARLDAMGPVCIAQSLPPSVWAAIIHTWSTHGPKSNTIRWSTRSHYCNLIHSTGTLGHHTSQLLVEALAVRQSAQSISSPASIFLSLANSATTLRWWRSKAPNSITNCQVKSFPALGTQALHRNPINLRAMSLCGIQCPNVQLAL